MSEEGRIEVGPCRCPGQIHGVDWVELYPDLTLDGGLAVAYALSSGEPMTQMSREVTLALMVTETKAWSFLNEDGTPAPITEGAVRHFLPYQTGGAIVANAVAPRILEAAQTDPFKVRQTRRSSVTGPTPRKRRSSASISPSPST